MSGNDSAHYREVIWRIWWILVYWVRQQHVRTVAGDSFINLVLYNIILECYVLTDLKVG